MNNRKLYKSNDKKFSGVCAGIAEYFGIDPTIVRIIYALFTFFTAGLTGVIIYAILAMIMEDKPAQDAIVVDPVQDAASTESTSENNN